MGIKKIYIRGLGEMNTLEYKERIIELITAIENEWILDRILKFIIGITK